MLLRAQMEKRLMHVAHIDVAAFAPVIARVEVFIVDGHFLELRLFWLLLFPHKLA